MMTDLLAHKTRLVAFVTNLSHEDFTQEGVQRLLNTILRVTTSVLLTAQRSQEPLQHRQTALRRILLVRRRDEKVRMLDPVAWEFSCRLVR
jgi:hypothetical protein